MVQKRKTRYFQIGNYYRKGAKECPDCPNAAKRIPKHEHFHCLVCHKNIKRPDKSSRIVTALKTHYKRHPTDHDLNKPPRKFRPSAFHELFDKDKAIVTAGNLIESFFNFEINLKFL
jgi:hypothetical protein